MACGCKGGSWTPPGARREAMTAAAKPKGAYAPGWAAPSRNRTQGAVRGVKPSK